MVGSNLNSRYGTQYQTLKKTINYHKQYNNKYLSNYKLLYFYNNFHKIKLSDVFFDESLIKVHGKRNKERLVPMLPTLSEKMKDYIKLRSNISSSKSNLFITSRGAQVYH